MQRLYNLFHIGPVAQFQCILQSTAAQYSRIGLQLSQSTLLPLALIPYVYSTFFEHARTNLDAFICITHIQSFS